MQKPTITYSGNDRYALIALTANALKEVNQKEQLDSFMQSIYVDADYNELLDLAKNYVEIIVKPTIEFDSQGESGNIHYIIALCQKVLRKQHRINDYNTMRDRIYKSNSYKNALAVIREYINLIDIRGIE